MGAIVDAGYSGGVGDTLGSGRLVGVSGLAGCMEYGLALCHVIVDHGMDWHTDEMGMALSPRSTEMSGGRGDLSRCISD